MPQASAVLDESGRNAANGVMAASAPLISVTDPVKHGDGVNAYMSYRVVSQGGERGDAEQTAIRRFSDFEWLHTRLCAVHRGIIVPPLPDKNVVEKFRFSKDFIETRRRALEKFINRVAVHPVLCKEDELRRFLEDDEEAWSRQTMVSADPKGGVFGKKSSEYMNILKEVQWSLSSVVMGRPAPVAPAAPPPPVGARRAGAAGPAEADGDGSHEGPALSEDETERLKLYSDELERIFVDAHKQALMFLRKQKETASSLASLGSALSALGQAEAAMGQQQQLESSAGAHQRTRAGEAEGLADEAQSNGVGGGEAGEQGMVLGEAFMDAGKRCESVAGMIMQQGSEYTEQVEESLREYVRMVHSFKRVLTEHATAQREERHLQTEAQVKKARLDKLNAAPTVGAMDRIKDLEVEVKDAEAKVTAAVAAREKITLSLQDDLYRFHAVLLHDVSALMAALRRLHSDAAQRSSQCWAQGLPLLRQASAALHSRAGPAGSGTEDHYAGTQLQGNAAALSAEEAAHH